MPVVPEDMLLDREAITTSWPDLRPDFICVYSPLDGPRGHRLDHLLAVLQHVDERARADGVHRRGGHHQDVGHLADHDGHVGGGARVQPRGLPVTVMVTGKVVTPLEVVPSWLTLVTTP